MRHEAKNVARSIEDAGDVSCGAIDVLKVAKCDSTLAFEAVQRRFVGLVVAVVVSDGKTKYSPTVGTRLKHTAECTGRGVLPVT